MNTNRVKKFSRELAAYRGDARVSPGRSVIPHSKVQTHPCSWCAVVMLGPCAQRLTGFPGTAVTLGCISWSSFSRQVFLLPPSAPDTTRAFLISLSFLQAPHLPHMFPMSSLPLSYSLIPSLFLPFQYPAFHTLPPLLRVSSHEELLPRVSTHTLSLPFRSLTSIQGILESSGLHGEDSRELLQHCWLAIS